MSELLPGTLDPEMEGDAEENIVQEAIRQSLRMGQDQVYELRQNRFEFSPINNEEDATNMTYLRLGEYPPTEAWDPRNVILRGCFRRRRFETTYIGWHPDPPQCTYVKIFTEERMQPQDVARVANESQNQSALKHKNVLRLFHTHRGFGKITMMLEFASLGTLREHLMVATRFPETTSARLLYDIASAIDYCHQKKIIHRDVKPENVLLTLTGVVKLRGFACSVYAPSDRVEGLCGTPSYMAPEVVIGYYNHAVDIWGLGVMYYEFLTGKVPFVGNTLTDIMEEVLKYLIVFPPHLSTRAVNLICKLLLPPNNRLPAADILHNPWVLSLKDHNIEFLHGFIL